ncbi:hypothetical protein R1sor_026272 [Riccia sorocarpa]|uniref:DUF7811 domain-containing protein n=1 Tax=Riccia sorocarpa TaxID=122646 RepID=A0ABD3GGK7_9MARC
MAESFPLTATKSPVRLPRAFPSANSVKTALSQVRSSTGISPDVQLRLRSRIWGGRSFAVRLPASLARKGARREGVIAASSKGSAAPFGADDDSFKWSGWSPRDGNGLYPWDPMWDSITLDDVEWVQEDVVTLFTAEGVVKIGGSRVAARRATSSESKYLSKLRRYREEDYMDPNQRLCLGAIFDIAATNGLDMSRRFCVFGFCRSIEMLSDVVEDTVLELGGEVVVAEKETSGGLHEKLIMTVAMPALWGVPPAVDKLNVAIRTGGGIVEKVYRKWEFF